MEVVVLGSSSWRILAFRTSGSSGSGASGFGLHGRARWRPAQTDTKTLLGSGRGTRCRGRPWRVSGVALIGSTVVGEDLGAHLWSSWKKDLSYPHGRRPCRYPASASRTENSHRGWASRSRFHDGNRGTHRGTRQRERAQLEPQQHTRAQHGNRHGDGNGDTEPSGTGAQSTEVAGTRTWERSSTSTDRHEEQPDSNSMPPRARGRGASEEAGQSGAGPQRRTAGGERG